jgi:hypothetical protein
MVNMLRRTHADGPGRATAGEVIVSWQAPSGTGTVTTGTFELYGWGDGGIGFMLCDPDTPPEIGHGRLMAFDDCF